MAKFKVIKGHTKVYVKEGFYYPIGEVGSIIETEDKELITALTKSICVEKIGSTAGNTSPSKKKSGGK